MRTGWESGMGSMTGLKERPQRKRGSIKGSRRLETQKYPLLSSYLLISCHQICRKPMENILEVQHSAEPGEGGGVKGPGARPSLWLHFLRYTATAATCILGEVSNEIKLGKAQQWMNYNCRHVLRKDVSIIFSGIFSKSMQGGHFKLIKQTITWPNRKLWSGGGTKDLRGFLAYATFATYDLRQDAKSIWISPSLSSREHSHSQDKQTESYDEWQMPTTKHITGAKSYHTEASELTSLKSSWLLLILRSSIAKAWKY